MTFFWWYRTESNIGVNKLIFNTKTLAGFTLKMDLDRFNEENTLWRKNVKFEKIKYKLWKL